MYTHQYLQQRKEDMGWSAISYRQIFSLFELAKLPVKMTGHNSKLFFLLPTSSQTWIYFKHGTVG